MGSVNSHDLNSITELPFFNEPATNLKAGIQSATSEFYGPAHRLNAKRVMIVFASSFNPQGQDAPQQVADIFKESGGILIVYSETESGHHQTYI